MKFERGLDPKEALGIGRKANPRLVIAIEENFPNSKDSRLLIRDGLMLIMDVCVHPKSEVLSSLQNRSVMLVFPNGDKTNIRYMWGEWISYGGIKCQIPKFLKPKGVSKI